MHVSRRIRLTLHGRKDDPSRFLLRSCDGAWQLKLPGLKVPAAPPPPPVPELSLPGGIAPATMPTSLKLPSPSSASKPAGVVKLGRVPKVPAPPSPAHATTEGTKLKLKTGGARVAQNKVEGEVRRSTSLVAWKKGGGAER